MEQFLRYLSLKFKSAIFSTKMALKWPKSNLSKIRKKRLEILTHIMILQNLKKIYGAVSEKMAFTDDDADDDDVRRRTQSDGIRLAAHMGR